MRELKQIIIHHSDSDVSSHQDISVIEQWHKERGFKKVGYHFFITWDGRVQKGRDIEEVGAHTLGQNEDSISICLGGRYKFTDDQFQALKALIFDIFWTYGYLPIFPHSFYNKEKICPGFLFKDQFGF